MLGKMLKHYPILVLSDTRTELGFTGVPHFVRNAGSFLDEHGRLDKARIDHAYVHIGTCHEELLL